MKNKTNQTEEKIIVSACLAGIPCRYNGKSASNLEVINMIKQGKAIAVCPEVLGGLTTPRAPAEIVGEKVKSVLKEDFTTEFILGAEKTLEIAQLNECKKAILKSGSPSCGYGKIYDGTFSGNLKAGNGITAQLLSDNNIDIQVY